MSIDVEIGVNGDLVKVVHIIRVSGEPEPDSVNDYMVDERVWPNPWDSGKTAAFKHRFGDGIDVCVAKALTALGD